MIRKINRDRLANFLKNYSTEERTLNIGSGADLYHYKKIFPNSISIDINADSKPDIVGDAHNMPFKDAEFQTILCAEVLEHLVDPKKAIGEMSRVLKTGGKLILTTRFVYPLHDVPHDYWRFTKYGLLKLFENWEVIELVPETESFSTIAVLLQRIGYQSILKANKVSKLFVFISASIFNALNFLIKKEYGDIKRESPEDHIMPSGYYIVVKKKS